MSEIKIVFEQKELVVSEEAHPKEFHKVKLLFTILSAVQTLDSETATPEERTKALIDSLTAFVESAKRGQL